MKRTASVIAMERNTSDSTLSEQLARFLAALSFEKIPDEIIEAAKLHILDALGCLLAGASLEAGRLAYELAASSGDATSTLAGSDRRSSLLAAVHALIFRAEKYGGSGASFIEGAIAGYETVIRVGLSIEAPKLFARGWWPSTICGAFAVAAAGAKFLHWPAEKTANALGIAALHAGGMLTGGNEGATARHLAFGHAAQNGVLALLAAERGFTGPKRAF